MPGFTEQFDKYKLEINFELSKIFDNEIDKGNRVAEAAWYSLSSGGKRIRPILALAFSDMFSGKHDVIMPYASAIEMIHAFSLIHDDLPGIDNDEFRRGIPTCHTVYGEGTAILAGDALLNKAYELLLDNTFKSGNNKGLQASIAISKAVGLSGMIGGQGIDILSSGKSMKIEKLTEMHSKKTGALIAAPVEISAIICNAPPKAYNAALEYAKQIGLAFQIKDDILDLSYESVNLGKTSGKDAASGKCTFVTVLGSDNAYKYLEDSISHANKSLMELRDMGYDTLFIEELTKYLLNRKN